MTNTSSLRPSDLVASCVRELRLRNGWTARYFAERCAGTGEPGITANVIANIETGRRGDDGQRRREVTIEEIMVFAKALDVPLSMILPMEDLEASRGTTV